VVRRTSRNADPSGGIVEQQPDVAWPGAPRLAGAIALGAMTWFVALGSAFIVLRQIWPAYVTAEPEKAYTLPMLFSRLFIYGSAISATSAVAARFAGDERLGWLAGAIILAISIPSHLYPGYVWDDYPAWYHLSYLCSILPISWAAGRWSSSRAKQRVPEPAA